MCGDAGGVLCEPTGGSASDAGGHRDWGSECEGVTRVGNVSPKVKNQRESSSVHTPLALAFQQMLGAHHDSLSIWGRGWSGRDGGRPASGETRWLHSQ